MPERTTNLQRIVNCLAHNRYVCDDCLSAESGVMPRQTVNRLCRENSQLISECEDQVCDGQCRKDHKILRFIPRRTNELLFEDESKVAASEGVTLAPKVDEIVDDVESATSGDHDVQELADARFSRRGYLHRNFNDIVQRALELPPADYLGRLRLEGLMDLKVITSNIHAVITLKLTFALVDWLEATLKLTPEHARALNDAADASKPFASGFDLSSTDPDIVAEVKGNIPVGGGSEFQAAQLKGLTNDVRQMFGLPPMGRTLESMSEKSKVHRGNLSGALKFLGVYDTERVRAAAGKWMTSFRNAHPDRNLELAENARVYAPDTVYVVFLAIPESQ